MINIGKKNKSTEENESLENMGINSRNRPAEKFKGMTRKKKIILGCGVVILIAGIIFVVSRISSGKDDSFGYEIVTAEKRSIVRTVDGSSVIEANDTYDVTALVTGEILTDTFNEGDIVKKDQLLYTIESGDAQDKVEQAQNSLKLAQQNFEDAVKRKADTVKTNNMSETSAMNGITRAKSSLESAQRTYNTALDDYNNLNIKSGYTGKISEVLVKEGDNVGNGTKIASVYNDAWFKMQVPFIESDAALIAVGSGAEVTIASSGDKLAAEVTAIASATTSTDAHAIVRYITVTVGNPGGLKAGERASVVVGDIACSDLGTLEYYEDGYITSEVSGTLRELYIDENDSVTSSQVVGLIDSDAVYNSLKNAETSLNNAKLSLNEAYDSLSKVMINNDTYSLDSSIQSSNISLLNAKTALESAEEKLEDYMIKAPIDGTIITKNKKAGDKLEQNNSSGNEPMAVIYDMSTLTVQLTIDETEIHDIKVGQRVMITADAVAGRFEGEVKKVGVNGTSSNGVTTYPVDITISEYGGLLPGMNVDCVIEIERAEDVLAVPVAAVQRGGMVYVKGEKTEENDMAPEGYHSVSVTTGITDSVFIEIKEGLNEGDELCGARTATGVDAQAAAMQNMQNMQRMPGGMGGMPGGMGGANRMGGAGGANRMGGMGGANRTGGMR